MNSKWYCPCSPKLWLVELSKEDNQAIQLILKKKIIKSGYRFMRDKREILDSKRVLGVEKGFLE